MVYGAYFVLDAVVDDRPRTSGSLESEGPEPGYYGHPYVDR